jgi:hypothetical protein
MERQPSWRGSLQAIERELRAVIAVLVGCRGADDGSPTSICPIVGSLSPATLTAVTLRVYRAPQEIELEMTWLYVAGWSFEPSKTTVSSPPAALSM